MRGREEGRHAARSSLRGREDGDKES